MALSNKLGSQEGTDKGQGKRNMGGQFEGPSQKKCKSLAGCQKCWVCHCRAPILALCWLYLF